MSIDWLINRMSQWTNDPAIIWSDQLVSYYEILKMVNAWQGYLDQQNIGLGQVVALRCDYSPKAVALLLALIDRRTISVPMTEAIAVHWKEFLDIAEVEVEIAFDGKDDWKIEKRDIKANNALILKLRAEGEAGLILFSSGSTGKNKAVLHNFSRLLEKFRVKRHKFCTLTFLLLDHIGGINTLLYTLSNGGSAVALQSRDPDAICEAIERYRVELLPTSPTFLNLLLLSEAYKRYDLSSLQIVTYGTEVMPSSTLRRLNQILPDVRFQQTYGLSELGILRSKSKDPESLWMKVGGEGFKTKIINGVLWIKAESAMLGYLNAPSPFDDEGWMNTGDMVEVDGEYIRVIGRKTDIINVGGQKVYPAEVENVLLQMDNVKDVVVSGEKNPITGNIIVAKLNLFQPEDPLDLKRRTRSHCKDKLAQFKIPVKVEIADHDQFGTRFKKMRRSKSGEQRYV